MKHLLIATLEDQDITVIHQCFAEDFEVRACRDKVAFLTTLRRLHPELSFIDIRLLLEGRESLVHKAYEQEFRAFWEASSSGPLIVLSPPLLLREAVKAVKAGASNYLTSPMNQAEVSYVTESLQDFQRVQLELDYLRGRFGVAESAELLQTNSTLMREVLQKIEMVASTRTTVLLNGETGVGKSTLAKLIHRQSTRRDEPFVSVHCGAIPDTLLESELFGHERGAFTGAVRRKQGKFEIANGGTIFLDEVGVLSAPAQIKLLSVLQERVFQRVGGENDIEVDVRIVAATNIGLKSLCDKGLFRSDLYYRLNVFPIEIPPLRERKEDILLLTLIFLKRLQTIEAKAIEDVDQQVIEAFNHYDWPGNVRELQNLIERAFILEQSSVLTPESFPAELFSSFSPIPASAVDTTFPLAVIRQTAIETVEKQYLEAALRENNGRVNQTARMAGVGVRQLHKLLTKHGLRKEEFR